MHMTGKRVLVLDGSARALFTVRRRLLERLVERGHHVRAVGARDTGLRDVQLENLEERFQAIGAPLLWWRCNRQGMNPIADAGALLRLRALIRRERPDVLLSYSAKPSMFGGWAATSEGVRCSFAVITGLGYLFDHRPGRPRPMQVVGQQLLRNALRNHTVVFFQNSDDRDTFVQRRLLSRTTRPVVVNGSGVGLDQYTTAPFPLTLTFLMIARVQLAKGVAEFFEAARLVKAKHPGVRIRLVGPLDNHPTAVAKAQLQRWLAEGNVEYLGGVPEVRPYLYESSVFVLPSHGEGVPRSSLEAMASGRPVVTTDVPGCRETVRQGVNGFLVPRGDATALAAAMEQFAQNPALLGEMGAASRSIAETKFNVEDVVGQMVDAMAL
jgi:glycosyltransferase involved in cell wall biosynthesis